MNGIDSSVEKEMCNQQLTNYPSIQRGDFYIADSVATSLDGLRGEELQTSAETVIINAMLKRADLLAPSVWHSILAQNSSDPMISLQEFLDKWSEKQRPLNDTEILALLSRFGSPYEELQKSLQQAAQSNVNRSYLISDCYKRYNCKSIKKLCMCPSVASVPFPSYIEINQLMMYEFISSWEDIINLIEIQISRSDKYIVQNSLINEPLKDGVIKTLLRQLGIYGIHSYQIKPIINNALLFSGGSNELTLLDLQTYCRARVSSLNSKDNLSSMTKEFNSLLRPFSCQLSSSSIKWNPRNLLSLISTLHPDSSGHVFSQDFLILMNKEYPNIQKSLSSALIKCVTNNNDNNNNNNNKYNNRISYKNKDNCKISIDNFQLFCYPKGFSFSVFMILGSFKIKNSRINPLDTIDKLYALASKQLFFSLRKHRPSDPNLKVPNDFELFLDSNYTKLISNNNEKTIISIFDDNSKLYGKSEYVNDLFEFENHLKEKKEMIEKQVESCSFSNGNKKAVDYTVKNGVQRSSTGVSKAVNIKKNKDTIPGNNNNVKNNDRNSDSNNDNSYDNNANKNRIMEKYDLESDSTFHVPPAPLFLGLEGAAHNWGIPMSVKVCYSDFF